MRITVNDNTLISVVTPVYNGERFIRKTYECLCRQTYHDWEWSVVNDGSTDGSHALLMELALDDERIIYSSQDNSGAAKMPRDRAVVQSRGRFILPLDIDDSVADDYLEKMMQRQRETDADIVYPRMIFIDLSTGTTTQQLPVADFDTSRLYNGRQLVKETAPEWRIGCNGGLYKYATWVNKSWPLSNGPVWMNSDEVDERLYLLRAERVAFSDARYFYQNHEQSITTRLSPKLFHTMKTSLQLIDLAEHEFGTGSDEHQRMLRRAFCDWRWKMSLYARHYRELEDADAEIHQSLDTCFQHLDADVLTPGERLKFLWLKSFPATMAMFCLKYSPTLLLRKAMQRLCPQYYLDHYVRPRTERKIRQQIASSYVDEPSAEGVEPAVVSMFSGNAESGGLVDRLRGAVTTFIICQEEQRPFKLCFTSPFRLEDYLEPRDYDWTVDDGSLTFARQQTATLVASAVAGTQQERQRHRRQLQRAIRRHSDRQLHVYTNAACCYDENFREAFHTLFRPTARLAAHYEQIRRDIGRQYITVSARFCNLLDDFNEEVYSLPLLQEERDRLVSDCLAHIAELHKRHPQTTIVVCSDSQTFLSRCRNAADTYVIPGTVSHIGNDVAHDYDYYEKTFLDFLTIAGASHVYLLLGPGMMQSGFPYAAALSEGRPYDIITF